MGEGFRGAEMHFYESEGQVKKLYITWKAV